MLNQRLTGLFHKYVDKTATPAEKEAFFQLLAQASEEEIKALTEEAWEEFTPQQTHFEPAQSEAMLQNILHTQAITTSINQPSRYRLLIAAATIGAILLAGGAWLINTKKQPAQVAVIAQSQLKNDIAPGGNKAQLTLADGTKITLDSNYNGTLAKQGNTRILLNNGALAYKGVPSSNATVHFNTLTTPNGGQYHVTLPDGTGVWLNAASSLKYPTAFTGTQRMVSLTGEAYFEVAQNASAPFIVNAGDATVQVLGTHFNINAYSNEKTMRTTLLEGAIKVIKQQNEVLLTPGQQTQINEATGKFNVKTVDTEDVIAWKNEQFAFANMDIPTVMRQISRWYNVTIVFAGKPPTGEINGKISRNYNISQVLKMLEYTAGIKYSVEGQQVTIY